MLKKDDYLLAPLPEVGVKSINKDLAWTIGLCIADGTISSGKYRYYVRFIHEKEESYSKELMSVLETSFDGKVGSVKHGNGNGWRTNVSTKQSYQFYTNYIVGKGNKKKFTHEVFDLDKESRLNLLGGYFDGDGSICKAPKTGRVQISATTVSKVLAIQLQLLTSSFGVIGSITVVKGGKDMIRGKPIQSF